MPRTTLDPGWWAHPSIVRVGNSAAGAWARMLNWCVDNGSGGAIPESVVRIIASYYDMSSLVAERILERVEGGFLVKPFVSGRRLARAERKASKTAKMAEIPRAAASNALPLSSLCSFSPSLPSSLSHSPSYSLSLSYSLSHQAPTQGIDTHTHTHSLGADFGGPKIGAGGELTSSTCELEHGRADGASGAGVVASESEAVSASPSRMPIPEPGLAQGELFPAETGITSVVAPDGVLGPVVSRPDRTDLDPIAAGPVVGTKAKAKAKSKRPVPATDLAQGELLPAETAIALVITSDEVLGPIVSRPNRMARDLLEAGPGIDVPRTVGDAARWLRANPERKKRNGARFLLSWISRKQEQRSGSGVRFGSFQDRGKPMIQAYSPPSGPRITEIPPPNYDFGADDE